LSASITSVRASIFLIIVLFASLAQAGTDSAVSGKQSGEDIHSGFWPLDRTIRITSNFGESRGRRFHAGIDFSIGGVPGADLRSPVDGHVCRISASWRGYGLQLLIQGDDGRQYLFAHLLDMRDDLEGALRAEQRVQDDYHITLYPAPGDFSVQRGEVFARCGESGSGPAHLHFEVRDSLGTALNPMLQGFCPPDHRSPVIRRVAFLPEGDFGEFKPSPRVFRTIESPDPSVRVLRDTVFVSERTRLAVYATDRVDQTGSTLLPLRFMLASESDTLYHSRLTHFHFDHNRQSSGFFHRGLSEQFDRDFVQFWPQTWDLPFQDEAPYSQLSDGTLDPSHLSPSGESFLIEVEDPAGNLGRLQFFAKPRMTGTNNVDSANEVVRANKIVSANGVARAEESVPFVRTHLSQGVQMEHAPRSFLEPVLVEATLLSSFTDGLGGLLIGPRGLPIAENLTFSFPFAASVCDEESDRCALYFIEEDDTTRVGSNLTDFNTGRWKCSISEPGRYIVLSDTLAPRATLEKIVGGSSSPRPIFVWKIEEDLSGLGQGRLEIGGQTYYPRFEVDTDQLLLKPFLPLPAGPLAWTLYLEDRAGNSSFLKGRLQGH
jgi:hypothetical protein